MVGIEEKDFDRYVEHLKKIKTYPSNGELVFKHGKVVLEKILRSLPQIKLIYVMVRSKKGLSD